MLHFNTEKLELPKILGRLEEMCSSSLGKDWVASLSPSDNLEEIFNRQKETSEAVNCLRLYPVFTLGGIRDIRNYLWRVEKEGVLNPTELLEVLDTLQAGRKIKRFFEKAKEEFVILKNISSRLCELNLLEKEISKSIGEDGKIKDDASQKLAGIRRKLHNLENGIKGKLEQILRSGEFQKELQENLITIRNDRYVLPVKQEYRSRFPGLIHDQSASGATLFIEPIAIVEMNNELRKVQLEEKKEIEAILAAISKQIFAVKEELQITVDCLGQLDFIFAKSRLSYAMKGSSPRFNSDGYIKIRQGRHPLIIGEAVPLDLELGKNFDVLIITGPNTGGKTVALKTTGLLCLMAQCGLHIPAEPETELAVFKQIFADIGDEQSIEQSLSTFSSHMRNLVSIVDNADSKSLVLVDELGAGTDPVEGSALAMAILNKLHQLGAKIVATTHYSELKAFAYNTKGMENASVEFDPVSLKPTYRLLIGTPGRSNALEIAGRLGLNKQVVDMAKGYISKDELEVGALIEELEERRQFLEKEQAKVNAVQVEMQVLREKLEEKRKSLLVEEHKILEGAQLKAKRIINETQAITGGIIAELKENTKIQEKKEQERAFAKARQLLRGLKEKNREALEIEKEQFKDDPPPDVKPGEMVYLMSLQQRGRVLTSPNNQNEVQVQVGIMKVQVSLSELRILSESAVEQSFSNVSALMMDKSSNITSELDLLGLTVEEALEVTTKYLDDALLSNLVMVTLIHGKGTGALRLAVQALLQEHPHVKGFRLGSHGEGGSGVTIVELKS
ncbi:MAG: endonuclease MutS2 [Bacillota bacterium]